MNQRSLIAIIILAGIGSIGTVLAYTGTITANQGSFNNVLVTGTCTGCGANEGSFTTWTTLTNTTVGTVSVSNVNNVIVSNGGSILAETVDCKDAYFFINATVIKTTNSLSLCPANQDSTDQSMTGEYQIIYDADRTNNIYIYKNNILQTTKTISTADFSGGVLSSTGIGISPNGKYIVVYGIDTGAAAQRLIVLQGS